MLHLIKLRRKIRASSLHWPRSTTIRTDYPSWGFLATRYMHRLAPTYTNSSRRSSHDYRVRATREYSTPQPWPVHDGLHPAWWPCTLAISPLPVRVVPVPIGIATLHELAGVCGQVLQGLDTCKSNIGRFLIDTDGSTTSGHPLDASYHQHYIRASPRCKPSPSGLRFIIGLSPTKICMPPLRPYILLPRTQPQGWFSYSPCTCQRYPSRTVLTLPEIYPLSRTRVFPLIRARVYPLSNWNITHPSSTKRDLGISSKERWVCSKGFSIQLLFYLMHNTLDLIVW